MALIKLLGNAFIECRFNTMVTISTLYFDILSSCCNNPIKLPCLGTLCFSAICIKVDNICNFLFARSPGSVVG